MQLPRRAQEAVIKSAVSLASTTACGLQGRALPPVVRMPSRPPGAPLQIPSWGACSSSRFGHRFQICTDGNSGDGFQIPPKTIHNFQIQSTMTRIFQIPTTVTTIAFEDEYAKSRKGKAHTLGPVLRP